MYLLCVELMLFGALSALTVQLVKYYDLSAAAEVRAWGWDDVALGGNIGLLAFLALWIHPWLYAALSAGLFVLFFALWMDALLFRIFTIELGFDGVGGVVATLLFAELAAFTRARRFFAENLAFAAFPALVGIGLLRMMFPPDSLWRGLSGFLLAVYFTVIYRGYRCRVRRERPASMALAWFFRARPFPDIASVELAPEHRALIDEEPRAPSPSPRFGVLAGGAGTSVVIFSFESAGRAHVAETKWVAELSARGVRSKNHFCVSPTTNNAHAAWYAEGSVLPLVEAGYRTVYLTTVETKHFGLRPILERAGFEHIIDASMLAPHALDGGKLSDYALLSAGLKLIAALPDDGPKLIHVHAANTHVPYRVVDGARFARHDTFDDRGRFLNGLEETDFIFSELLRELGEKNLLREPLVVLTSDHGQSFGESGYHSHGSAVTSEQLMVPLVLQHPNLVPGELEYSSHYDLIPTVLDLLGLHAGEGWGESIFRVGREPKLLVWAGHPSRSTTTNFGLVLGDKKIILDLVRDRCAITDWSDGRGRELRARDKEYYSTLLSRLMKRRGIA